MEGVLSGENESVSNVLLQDKEWNIKDLTFYSHSNGSVNTGLTIKQMK